VLFSQTYKPSKTQELVFEWKETLEKQGKGKVSRLLGVPGQDEELFPDWDEYIKLEEGADGATAPAKVDLIDVDGDEAPETNGTAKTDGEQDGDEAAEMDA